MVCFEPLHDAIAALFPPCLATFLYGLHDPPGDRPCRFGRVLYYLLAMLQRLLRLPTYLVLSSRNGGGFTRKELGLKPDGEAGRIRQNPDDAGSM